MGALQKAIQDVKFAIPREILEEVFIRKEFNRTPMPVSLDAMIREKVINERVIPDCNLAGGNMIEIPLDNVPAEQIDTARYIYRIPANLTQNRKISRVVSLTIGPSNTMNNSYMGVNGYSQILDAAQGMMNAQMGIPIVSTAYIRLVGDNVLLVSDVLSMPRTCFLRCYLEYDDEFNTLQPTTYRPFSKLVELATKAYIYNNQVIPTGMNRLVGGMELGRYREIVDSYSDANQMYLDYIDEVWQKVMFMDDRKGYERSLRLVTGGNN